MRDDVAHGTFLGNNLMGVLFDYKHSKSTRRVLRKMVSIVCPSQLYEMKLESTVVGEVELALRALPSLPRKALLVGIKAFENAARFMPSHFGKSFSQLGDADAEAYFESWATSPMPIQKQFIKGIRGLICIGYYDLPSVQKSIRYTPKEWAQQSKEKRLKKFLTPILAHEASLISRDPLPLRGNPKKQSGSGKSS